MRALDIFARLSVFDKAIVQKLEFGLNRLILNIKSNEYHKTQIDIKAFNQ